MVTWQSTITSKLSGSGAGPTRQVTTPRCAGGTGKGRDMNSTRTIEICCNDEWICGHMLDPERVDLDGWEAEASADWYGRVESALERLGYETECARGQRILYHGWNGANTFARKDAGLGTFDALSDEEWAACEAAAYAATVAVAGPPEQHVSVRRS